MKKIILIHNIINPTRTFLFNEMRKSFRNLGYDFKVLFLSASDKNRDWEVGGGFDFEYEVLDNHAVRLGKKDTHTFFINPKMGEKLKEENPDIIICFGWDHLNAYVANHWARKNNKKFIFFAESTVNEKSWRRTLSSPLVKYFVAHVDLFWAGGTRAKEYLMQLGAPEKKIQLLHNSIDIDFFTKKAQEFSAGEKQKLKNKLGLKTSKVILFIGQLIERKGVFELLEGFSSYQKTDPDVSLLFVGSGQEKEKMQKIIKEQDIQNVFFGGFVQYEETYKYYAISDLFILPSHEEVWGLVINEAAACGLPIITTTVTGASVDLICEGKNGYVIKPKCAECITKAIEKVFTNNLHKKNTSLEIVQKTNIPSMLKNITL